MLKICLTLAVAWVGFQAAKKFHLPAPAMIGSMLAVGLTNIIWDYACLPTWVRISAQAISGGFIGMQITQKDVRNAKYLLKPFFLLVLMLTANTFVTGVVVHKIAGIDYVTALLGSVAGGVTDISMLSIDLGGDTPIVALMQTLRLVGVLLFFPYWIRFFTRNEGDAEEDVRLVTGTLEMGETWLDRLIYGRNRKLAFTMIVCLAAGFAGYASGVPAGAMVFAIVVIVLLNITTSVCYVPLTIKTVAQLLAGAVVGCSIHPSALALLNGGTVIALLILMVNYWLVNLIYSTICKKKGMLDLKSAMLASAPGGATDMSLIAADLNADLTKIALIQVLRAIYAVTFMPMVIVLFVNWVR